MKGYTLLELLIVLVVIGLLSSIAFPRLKVLYDGGRFIYEKDEVVRQLASLGYKAYATSTRFTLLDSQSDEGEALELPEGWRVVAESPVEYRENGVCSGGLVRLLQGERSIRLKLSPPFCRPELL